MAPITLDALYRQIAMIGNPLLCWSLASTKWNDNGICIPKELCSKIRSYLPPTSLDSIKPLPGDKYVIDENICLYKKPRNLLIEVETDGVKSTLRFRSEGSSDYQSLHPLGYTCNTGELRSITLSSQYEPMNFFVHEINDFTVYSYEPASDAKFREVAFGGFKCQIPISKLDFTLPDTLALVQELGSAIEFANTLTIRQLSTNVVQFNTMTRPNVFRVVVNRGSNGRTVMRSRYDGSTICHDAEYRRTIHKLAALFI